MEDGKKKRVVVFDPHPDDADWWTGGLTLLMKNEGCKIDYVCAGPTEEETRQFALESARILGVERHFFEIPLLHSPELTGRLSDAVSRLFAALNPNIVIIPPRTDYHQEHVILSRLLFEFLHWSHRLGFYDIEVYEYDSVENRNPIEVLIDISSVWKQHMESLRCHKNFLRLGIPESTLVYTKTGRAMILGATFYPDGPVRYAEGYNILQGNHRTISSLPSLLGDRFAYRSQEGLLEM